MVRMPNASTCLEGIRFDLCMCIAHVPLSIVILRTSKLLSLLCVVRAFLTVTHRYVDMGSQQVANTQQAACTCSQIGIVGLCPQCL